MDTDWSLLGGNPTPGDAGLIRKLATDYIDVAKGALDVSTGLAGPKGDLASVWSGGAAVTLVDENIDAASEDLKKAFDSFSEAGTALRSHADSLEALQSRALRLLEEAYAANGRIEGAISNRASFEESFRTTAADSGTSTLETEVQLRMQIGSYNDSVGVAEAGLESIRWQADQLREEHRTLGQATRRKIDSASEVGIQNAAAMSILGWKPFGDQFTWTDIGRELDDSVRPFRSTLRSLLEMPDATDALFGLMTFAGARGLSKWVVDPEISRLAKYGNRLFRVKILGNRDPRVTGSLGGLTNALRNGYFGTGVSFTQSSAKGWVKGGFVSLVLGGGLTALEASEKGLWHADTVSQGAETAYVSASYAAGGPIAGLVAQGTWMASDALWSEVDERFDTSGALYDSLLIERYGTTNLTPEQAGEIVDRYSGAMGVLNYTGDSFKNAGNFIKDLF